MSSFGCVGVIYSPFVVVFCFFVVLRDFLDWPLSLSLCSLGWALIRKTAVRIWPFLLFSFFWLLLYILTICYLFKWISVRLSDLSGWFLLLRCETIDRYADGLHWRVPFSSFFFLLRCLWAAAKEQHTGNPPYGCRHVVLFSFFKWWIFMTIAWSPTKERGQLCVWNWGVNWTPIASDGDANEEIKTSEFLNTKSRLPLWMYYRFTILLLLLLSLDIFYFSIWKFLFYIIWISLATPPVSILV